MDAREQLRRFLEQRREAGETELVFDSLSVEEAMRLLGASTPQATSKLPPGNERSARPGAATPANASDWRAVLAESGAAPAPNG